MNVNFFLLLAAFLHLWTEKFTCQHFPIFAALPDPVITSCLCETEAYQPILIREINFMIIFWWWHRIIAYTYFRIMSKFICTLQYHPSQRHHYRTLSKLKDSVYFLWLLAFCSLLDGLGTRVLCFYYLQK